MSMNIILIISLIVIIFAIYLNYFYFIKDKPNTSRHINKKKEKTKFENILMKKIDENVEMNNYKNLYDDCIISYMIIYYITIDRKLEKEINHFSETNEYMKNEIKLVKMIETLGISKKQFKELENKEREYMNEFNDDEINKIKELIHNLNVD
jgi:hypothetical protein